jgi:hypothetical protein
MCREREIPKLKLDIGCGDSIQKSILKVLFNSEISYLQEFQYGKKTVHTTTIQFGGVKNRPSIRE